MGKLPERELQEKTGQNQEISRSVEGNYYNDRVRERERESDQRMSFELLQGQDSANGHSNNGFGSVILQSKLILMGYLIDFLVCVCVVLCCVVLCALRWSLFFYRVSFIVFCPPNNQLISRHVRTLVPQSESFM